MNQPGKAVRVIVATTTLFSRVASGRGGALALAELGGIAFFASGVAERAIGPAAPWFLLCAVLVGLALRAVDLENCGLFVPGGLYGTVREAFGRSMAKAAAAALLVEHLLFGGLAASAAGHYVVALGQRVPGGPPFPRGVATGDLAAAVAVCLVGVVWWRQRQGRPFSTTWVTRVVGASVTLCAAIVSWGVITLAYEGRLSSLLAPAPDAGLSVAAALTGLGYCLFAVGGIAVLGRVAPEFPQPRIHHLRATARLLNVHALVVTASTGFLFVALVPAASRQAWSDAPVAALALSVGAPDWINLLLLAGTTVAALLFLTLAVQRALVSVQGMLSRLSEEGVLARSMRDTHTRFGTPNRLVNLSGTAALAVILVSGGQLAWLARAYVIGVVAVATLAIAALIRFRARRSQPRAYRVGLNVRAGAREWPLGLLLIGGALAVPGVVLLASGDPATVGGAAVICALTALLALSERRVAAEVEAAGAVPDVELLTTPFIGLDQMEVRPGNLLVAVRRPHVLTHLSNALKAAGDRDVVVMTVRMIGTDVSDDLSSESRTTDEERKLLAAVVRLAERHAKAVRLLIVPATNVFDALVDAILRLQSSEIYTGESETLSAADQARLLGEAWERASKPAALDVRLVIQHSSGRTAVYHLGAHAPTLKTDDLHLIHALWLDAVKVVGPHVHHRDVVRAALTHMEEQLNTPGTERDNALNLVRQVARPADELAAVVHQRDFTRLRDMVRNRPASDLASVLTDLTSEDQVVIFRTLPRETAAATFEYLSREAQEALVKGMAQEEVAGLLNNMSPDDRTMFLEELPASVTQQLLTLLKPEERAVAVTLLGYPEGSIGRLMTPDYIAVREHWTLQQVLDYVRAHGHDSETLNVLYIVDEKGVLVDDIRIREVLLADPGRTVADVVDRHFVALKATDDQQTAVAIFRREDRLALPVTDSAGVLIGIVTIDDVLDVAEAAATKEIQRIGGSEALGEPYMDVPFGRMIQKRAGWLTALFLGEMLTATAMGFFEEEIARAVVLALFVPLIISSGGNSGSQACTLVIRSMALGEVQLRDWWRVMRREIGAGVALGSILGTIGFLRIAVWSSFSSIYGPHWLLIGVTVGTTLVGVVLWGTLVGSLLPFLLRRLGFDPAASSAPFVATLVDVTGLVIYFSVGLVVLRGTLL